MPACGRGRGFRATGAGRCAAGRHEDEAFSSLSERAERVRPRGGDGGVRRFAAREGAPHFLWSCQRKRAAPGPKEKRFYVQILPVRAGLDKYGGRASRCPRKSIVFCRVRWGLGEQRGCCPAFGGLGGAFGVSVGFGTLLAPRLSPPKSRPDGRLAPIRACGRSRFATRYREVGGAAADGRRKSNRPCTPTSQFPVAGAELKVSAKPGPRPTLRLRFCGAVSCWGPSFRPKPDPEMGQV